MPPIPYRIGMGWNAELNVATRGRWATAAAILALTLGVAGCVESNRPDPSACAAPSITLELELTAAGLTPQDPAACRGQHVEVVVQSAVDGTLHIHGYDEEAPLIEVAAGELTAVSFVASQSGQFPIEIHTNETPEGASVGVLTVHEP
ncbi:MAG: hypothetical protein ABI841_06910 [Chloroflexota bacterium]